MKSSIITKKYYKDGKLLTGFTLIELIVVMAVFMFIVGAAISIFISVIQNQRRILSKQELLNQVSYIEEYMSKALRMATEDQDGLACFGSADYAGHSYMLTRQIGNSYTGIKFINASDSNACQEFYLDTAAGVLKELKNSTNDNDAVPVTSSKLFINSIRFVINGDSTLTNSSDVLGIQPRITISLNIQVKGDNSQPSEKIQTTVSQRNINTQGSSSITPSWQYKKPIIISHTNVGTVDLVNFPLLVKITGSSDLANAKADGTDVRFVDSNSAVLSYQRESWSGGNGSPATAIFWVKVPAISHTSDTTIYMYYGNSSAGDGQDAANVWDSDFKGVWHLDETGTSPQAIDSTSNHNDSTAQSWTPTAVNGKIGGAAIFNGSSNYITTPLAISGNQPLTISLWAKLDPGPYYYGYGYPQIANSSGGNGYDGIDLYAPNNNSYLDLYLFKTTNGWIWIHTNNNNTYQMGTGTLYYISATFDGNYPKIYVNGYLEPAGTWEVDGSANMNSGNIIFGNNAGENSYWKGVMDEIRVSDIPRPAGWVNFEYKNMSANNEITIGAQEPGS